MDEDEEKNETEWETPTYEEIRINGEIGAYQEDMPERPETD